MVRKASEFILDELALSNETKAKLIKKIVSPDAIVFEGRVAAFNRSGANYLIELADALDKAGFIRHDLDTISFQIWRLYSEVYGLSEIPREIRDLSIINAEEGIRSSKIGNNKYEELADPKNSLNDILSVIRDSLTEREAKIVISRFGLLDGEAYTLDEAAKEFSLSKGRIRQIEGRALRILRYDGRLPKILEFSEEWSNNIKNIIDELEQLREDPIFKKEAELIQELERVAMKPFTSVNKAVGYLDSEADKNHRSILELRLSSLPHNCLMRHTDIRTIDDILRFPPKQWWQIRGLGRRSMEEIQEKMRAAGYTDFTII